MQDLISRQAAIDAIENTDWYHLRDGVMVHGANSKEDEPLYKAEDVYKVLNDMPSAQPETHDKRTKTHACDSISRQAAIDAIEEMQMPIMRSTFPEEQFVFRGMSEALSAIKELPSAEPEMIREIRKWINSGNRGNADYFIVEKIEEIINKYE